MGTTNASSARSYLFVPGDRLDRLAKALSTTADIVILDLEDAVAAEAKLRARETIAAACFPRARVMVRINGCGTPWIEGDLNVMRTLGVSAVMVPKAEEASEIARIASRLGPAVPIIALIESALGVWQALDVARAPGVSRLAFGSLDFAEDAGTSLDADALLYARSRLVLASRVANLPQPIDGVTTETNDVATVQKDARAGQRLGFGAKFCIHPSQIDAVNAVFMPADEEVAWARAVLAAVERSGGAAVKLDGRMIDLPVIKRATRIANLSQNHAAR